MNDKMVIAQEATNTELCVETAKRNGHTVEDAENCDDGSVGCPDCPWRKVYLIVETGPDWTLGRIVERIVGKPEDGYCDGKTRFTLPAHDAKRAARQIKEQRNLESCIKEIER